VLTRLRQAYLERLEPFVGDQAQAFLAELAPASLEFRPGWKRAELSLADALLLNRERDIAQGHTGLGPHRADWKVEFAGLPGREALSRGQEKLAALACVLGQARDYAARRGDWPIVCLDDLASELDLPHQEQVLASALSAGAQVLLSGTQVPQALLGAALPYRLFHVEHGLVTSS
jgi:DNA replication and repair protein RecF